MINATPSLEAAEGLSGKDLAAYLGERGWTARASKINGISIFSKAIHGGDRPIDLVLPIKEGFPDEHRRVADALRTIAQIERQSEVQIADQIRSSRSSRISAESRVAAGDDPEASESEVVAMPEIEALSDAKIEESAALLRRKLGLLDEPAFNVADILQSRLPSVIDNFRLEFFAEADKPNLSAYYQNVPPRIFVRKEVFDRAYKGDPSARYTLAHELGHVFLLSRWQYLSSNRRQDMLKAMTFETSAHRFAMAFLMPNYLLRGMTDVHEISRQFKVSLAVAEQRMQALYSRAGRADRLRSIHQLLHRLGVSRTRT